MEKSAQTGETTEIDPDYNQNSLTERLLKDMKNVLKIDEESTSETSASSEEQFTIQDLDKSLEHAVLEETDASEVGTNMSCVEGIARLWADNDIVHSVTMVSTEIDECQPATCSNNYTTIWSCGLESGLPSVPAAYPFKSPPCMDSHLDTRNTTATDCAQISGSETVTSRGALDLDSLVDQSCKSLVLQSGLQESEWSDRNNETIMDDTHEFDSLVSDFL